MLINSQAYNTMSRQSLAWPDWDHRPVSSTHRRFSGPSWTLHTRHIHMIKYIDLARTTVDSTRSALSLTVPYHPPYPCFPLRLLGSSHLYTCSYILMFPQFMLIHMSTEVSLVIPILTAPVLTACSPLSASFLRLHPHTCSHALTFIYNPVCCYMQHTIT